MLLSRFGTRTYQTFQRRSDEPLYSKLERSPPNLPPSVPSFIQTLESPSSKSFSNGRREGGRVKFLWSNNADVLPFPFFFLLSQSQADRLWPSQADGRTEGALPGLRWPATRQRPLRGMHAATATPTDCCYSWSHFHCSYRCVSWHFPKRGWNLT